MKKYLIWFGLLMKRMIKKPMFVLLLAAMSLLAVMMNQMEGGETGEGVLVGIVAEDGTAESWSQTLLNLLQEQEGIITFKHYRSVSQLIQDVERGSIDCGVVIPEDLQEKIHSNAWRSAITIYVSNASNMIEIVKEKIASVIFIAYAEAKFEDYVRTAEPFQEAWKQGIAEGQDIDGEEIALFAKAAYESYLLDGSTFAFQYEGEVQNKEESQYKGYERSTGEERDQSLQGNAAVFPLRGILAVGIFVSGLCGLLLDCEDRRSKRFVRIAPNWMTTIVNIWVPTLYTSFAALLSLGVAGKLEWQGGGGGKELCHLLFYQFLIVLYCSIIRVILQKPEKIATAIPILTLAGLVCCPVWIRLSVYLPVFRVLERLFPITYYLLL